MKLIEGMKLKKELQQKAGDLRQKLSKHSAHMDIEGATYGTVEEQQKVIDGWLQSHQDIVKQMRKLGYAIQKTNIETQVEMEIAGKKVTLSISEWILRRRELATMECQAWTALTDRGLRDQKMKRSDGEGHNDVKVVRYFKAKDRDDKIDAFKHEPAQIDRKLEVINATTELVGYNGQ